MMAHLDNGGYFGQEVVGESHYVKALARTFDSGNKQNKNRSYVVVTLAPEDNNPYDKNAVAVVGEFGVLGYLSRDDAELYREKYGSVAHSADAVIVTRSGDKFGVWLDVDLCDEDEEFDDDLEDYTPTQKTFNPKPAKKTDAISMIARGFLWFLAICFVLGVVLGMIMS